VPLYLEEHTEEDIESALERTDFEEVWNVLQAMQEQDDELADIIRQLRENRGRTKGFDDSRLREKVEVLGPPILLEQIRGAVTTRLIDRLGVSWDERFGELQAYKEKHGDCNVPDKYETNFALASWCHTQRSLLKNSKLTKKRIYRLQSIEFDFDLRKTQWDKMYQSLVAYKKENGDCNVPLGFNTNLELAIWVGNQRTKMKRGKLSEERRKRFDAIGFDFDPVPSKWEEMYQLLVEYRKKNGDCNVPQAFNRKLKLGSWCSTQRLQWGKNKLSKERIERLEAIGFIFDQKEAQWNLMYQSLVAYKGEYGDCNVPSRFNPNQKLANWCGTQRIHMKNGALVKDRIERLEAIEFNFTPDSTQWEKMYQSLADYRKEHGHCDVPSRNNSNPKLARWCNTQRMDMKNRKLRNEKIERLEAIGFDFDQKETRWQKMYQSLVEYKETNGDCDVTQGFSQNQALWAWSNNLRIAMKKGKLSQDRVERLEAIGFKWSL
jgi:hypothetical protein